MVFVFLWLIPLSIMLCRSVHAVAKGKGSYFFTAAPNPNPNPMQISARCVAKLVGVLSHIPKG